MTHFQFQLTCWTSFPKECAGIICLFPVGLSDRKSISGHSGNNQLEVQEHVPGEDILHRKGTMWLFPLQDDMKNLYSLCYRVP